MHPQVSTRDPLRDLPPSDKALFVEFGVGPTVPSPFQCVHHAFESHARSQPDAIAVEDFEHTITYSELDRRANCLASRLQDIGVVLDSRICFLAERSIDMVVGILGILKAGAAYVPLDGNIVSDSTLKHALRGSGTSVVLVLQKFAHRVEGRQTICLEEIICKESNSHCTKPKDLSTSKHGVYVIYTSGTTGVPKGVDVTHGNATNLLCLAPGNLGMRPGLRVSQLMNISFDMAAWEILGSMCNGSTLCLRGKTSKQWREVMKRVDIVVATPSMLSPHKPSDYPNIKTVAVAGEPCPKALADEWALQAQFYNSCGPTEITIVNTMQDHSSGEFLTIGKPTPNNTVYVLDDDMKPLPIGAVGIMWAGGAGITRGYVDLPEKTAERYMLDPFTRDGKMMFNTGDLGRWLPNGTLEHLGRIDNQVKIKGFRVELDGVATAMETCSGVHAAVAILIEGQLWGFVTPSDVAPEDIKAAAAKIQPYYAVPTNILCMDSFPHTANGKTDRRELEKMARLHMSPPEVAKELTVSARPDTTITPEVVKTPTKVDAITVPIASYQPNSKIEDPEAVLSPSFGSPVEGAASVSDLGSEVSSLSAAKPEYPWSGYQDDVIPSKTQGKLVRNLRHQIFTLYRRLFGVVFITNMAIFISVIFKGANAQQIATIVIANLFCAILMRQDYVINAFFNTFCAVPPSWPLAIRRVCARVYHIGGLHSGCATSGVVWLVLFTGQATKEMVQEQKISIPTIVITYCILTLLIGIVIFAYPTIRSKKHNTFEKMHRFLGWTATALVWCQFVLLTNDYKEEGQRLGMVMIKSPPFWLLVILTGSIILPWVRLRKVPVRSVVLSNHAVRLYFDYVTPIPGSFTRISDDPLFEWHGFATVPVPGEKGYSLVVSRAGDWTAKQIQNPPTHLWVRGIPTFGVLRIVPLFRRLVFVATGSGIGPCAPCILEKRVPIRLLWTSPNVRETFGDEFVDAIVGASPDAMIYDTRAHGKPDMVKLTYRLVKEFNAEAVCVISNQKLTQKVVYGMMSRGIPAFGAIWDS
ncbi:Adenylate-forming reductase 03009 [Psilocybe cubensis]|uniref:AMP-dependent synthetase/ligase domain-containing protein n=2 Tax=Psilocybe cubensis TaxID=181762 RepID=A0A8H7Y1D2_PSICU|nr:Adenylate-forming reductase 03009 [Psilocybe cubensis]KAH9480438.1 Adenylate-forming reductase 03009 [Psilocybe cubensis]